MLQRLAALPHSRLLTARAMIQRLVVDCGVVFLYNAIQTSLFPMMLVTLKATHTLASVMTAAKLRIGSSRSEILPTDYTN